MQAWADNAAQSAGLTKNQYNTLGTLTGTQPKNGGTPMEDLAPKTNDLIGLGADLASMFGGTTADAVGALSSALKGERDPIEAYGVSLTQAAIDAKAAELGFSKVGGSLSSEATQAATLALIMDQTADAHGNFAKEASTVQGQQQRLTSALQNTKDTIGMALLPVVSLLLTMFNQNLMPIITAAAAAFTQFMGSVDIGGTLTTLMAAAEPLAGSLASLGAGLQPLIPLAGNLLMNGVVPLISGLTSGLAPIITAIATTFLPPLMAALSDIIPTITPVLAQVGALAAILGTVLGPSIQAMAPIVSAVFGAAADIIGNTMGVISGIIRTVTALIQGDWSGAWRGVQDTLGAVWGTIGAILNGGVNVAISILDWAEQGFRDAGWNMMAGLVAGLRSALSWVADTARSIASSAITAAKNALGIHSPSTVFRAIGTQTGQGLALGLNAMTGQVARASDNLVTSAIPSTTPTIPLAATLIQGSTAAGVLTAGDITVQINGGIITPETIRQLVEAIVAALNERARRLGTVAANQVVMA